MAAELVFILLCIAGFFALAMRQTSLFGWGLALGAAVFVWQTDLIHGELYEPEFGLGGILAWVPVIVLFALSIPAVRRAALTGPAYGMVKGILP
jgi:acyl-CoA dehydrogenase